jgi:hypothetical protein
VTILVASGSAHPEPRPGDNGLSESLIRGPQGCRRRRCGKKASVRGRSSSAYRGRVREHSPRSPVQAEGRPLLVPPKEEKDRASHNGDKRYFRKHQELCRLFFRESRSRSPERSALRRPVSCGRVRSLGAAARCGGRLAGLVTPCARRSVRVPNRLSAEESSARVSTCRQVDSASRRSCCLAR